jgi:hypothetical protein
MLYFRKIFGARVAWTIYGFAFGISSLIGLSEVFFLPNDSVQSIVTQWKGATEHAKLIANGNSCLSVREDFLNNKEKLKKESSTYRILYKNCGQYLELEKDRVRFYENQCEKGFGSIASSLAELSEALTRGNQVSETPSICESKVANLDGVIERLKSEKASLNEKLNNS